MLASQILTQAMTVLLCFQIVLI